MVTRGTSGTTTAPVPPLADATGGDPPATVLTFSPSSAAELLGHTARAVEIWPALEELRSAAHATKPSRLRLVASALVAEARLMFGACFLLARGNPFLSACASSLAGSTLHYWIRSLLAHGEPFLRSNWHWSHAQCQLLHASLSLVVAPSSWRAAPVTTLPFDPELLPWPSPARPFPAALCAFFHALRVGAPWADALNTFAALPDGHLSADGRIFAVPSLLGPNGRPDRAVTLSESDTADALVLYFSPAGLVAITSSHSLLPRPLPTPTAGLILSARGHTFRTLFLPPYIKLLKRPVRDVMSAYNASAGTNASALSTPRPARSFRVSPCPKFATWTWQGIVEMIPMNCPLPLFIEPLGAVDKATAPWCRLILDARLSNEF